MPREHPENAATLPTSNEGRRDLQRFPYLPVLDRPTFLGADGRDALSRASSRSRLSGSGSIDSCPYIARTTLPTPSITPFRTSRSGESLMAAPLACPPTFQKTTWQESSSCSWPMITGTFSRGFTLKYVLPRNSLLWISVSSREIVIIFQTATG